MIYDFLAANARILHYVMSELWWATKVPQLGALKKSLGSAEFVLSKRF